MVFVKWEWKTRSVGRRHGTTLKKLIPAAQIISLTNWLATGHVGVSRRISGQDSRMIRHTQSRDSVGSRAPGEKRETRVTRGLQQVDLPVICSTGAREHFPCYFLTFFFFATGLGWGCPRFFSYSLAAWRRIVRQWEQFLFLVSFYYSVRFFAVFSASRWIDASGPPSCVI